MNYTVKVTRRAWENKSASKNERELCFSREYWVIMHLIQPPIFNTGKYKITCKLPLGETTISSSYADTATYTVSVLGHKPGNIHDLDNPTPGKVWFREDKTYKTIESFTGCTALRTWFLKQLGKLQGEAAYEAFMLAEPEPKEPHSKGQSTSKQATSNHIECGRTTRNQPTMGWSSTYCGV